MAYREERDKIEQAIVDDPLWAAQQLMDIKYMLEQIESFVHEGGSQIAHRILNKPLFNL